MTKPHAGLRLFTATEISTYLACPRRWYWRFHELLVPRVPPKAPAFGTLLHARLAQHYGAPPPLTSAEERAFDPQEARLVQAQLVAILSAYGQHDPVVRLGHTVLAVERTFVVPMPSARGRARTAALAGKFDLVTEDSQGNVWLWDHKSCSTFANSDWLRLDLQMRLYLYAAYELRLNPVGIVYNMIRKPALKPHENENLRAYQDRLTKDILLRAPTYFRTELIASSPDLLEAVREELRAYRKVVGRGPYVRNPEACRYLGCVYMSLCLADSPLLRAAFVREEAHPELNWEEVDHGAHAA